METKTRKELRDEYKLKKPRIGVFAIRNNSNGKVFIASSLTLDSIWNRHKLQLEVGNHPNSQLQNDWKEFGESHFTFEILSELKLRDENYDTAAYADELKDLETLYIEELQPFGDKGYNKIK